MTLFYLDFSILQQARDRREAVVEEGCWMTERFDKCFIRPSCPVRPLIRLASRATFPVGEGFERLLQVFCNSPLCAHF